MTSAALSDDAMAAIKARRDSLARQSAKADAEEAHRLARAQASAGVKAFTAWFNKHRAMGEIVMSGDRMLDVQPALSNRFCIGMFDMRYYLGIPAECEDWFRELPWLHAVIGRDASSLSLVCERSRLPEVTLPEFSLNFEVGAFGMLKMMSNYHYLDVRLITQAASERADGGRSIHIGRDVLMTLDIRVVPGERTFTALLDGRKADGFQNRAVLVNFDRRVTDGDLREYDPPLQLKVPKTFKSDVFKRAKGATE